MAYISQQRCLFSLKMYSLNLKKDIKNIKKNTPSIFSSLGKITDLYKNDIKEIDRIIVFYKKNRI